MTESLSMSAGQCSYLWAICFCLFQFPVCPHSLACSPFLHLQSCDGYEAMSFSLNITLTCSSVSLLLSRTFLSECIGFTCDPDNLPILRFLTYSYFQSPHRHTGWHNIFTVSRNDTGDTFEEPLHYTPGGHSQFTDLYYSFPSHLVPFALEAAVLKVQYWRQGGRETELID